MTGIRKADVIEVPEAKIEKPTDVLLKVEVVGVCGSDIHYYTEGRIGSQVVKYPYRVGHECSATVVEAGRAVRHVKAGDRVAVEPAMSCGKCDQCRTGRRHTCRKIRFLGVPGQAEGCLCEYIVMPEHCCFPVKRKTTFEQAAIVEPLSIGLYAARFAGAMKKKRIAILGSGPIGLCVMLCALEAGVERVYVTDKLAYRLRVAKKAGADWVGNPDTMDVVGEIAEREPLLLDYVFECCGKQEALDQAVELLKPGGRLMLVGIPSVDRVSFAMDLLRRREICIQNVRRQNECVQPAIDLVENGRVKVDFMVTHRFPFSRTRDAFDVVADYRDGVVKAMIVMDK